MIFWLVCGILSFVAVVVIVRPLHSGARPNDDTKASALAIYRDQLAEIQRDKDRGLLSDSEAEAAEQEVSRRLLAAADSLERPGSEADDDTVSSRSKSEQPAYLAAGIASFLILGSLGGYLVLGSPGLPGQPHAERLRADPAKMSPDELIARVEARLQTEPDDARGWDVIAPVYLRRGQNRKAAQAYQQAIRLNGESARRLDGFGRAVLAVTRGEVTSVVKAAYERLQRLDPNHLPAKFWLAVWHEQQNDNKSAGRAYAALLKRDDLPPPFRQMVGERLRSVRGEAGGGEAERTEGEAGGLGAAPSQAAREDMARLSPDQRAARIRGMVKGLAERLEQDGGEVSEWKRLIRSYVVLGDRSAALVAAQKALAAFKDAPADKRAIQEHAANLGLKLPSD